VGRLAAAVRWAGVSGNPYRFALYINSGIPTAYLLDKNGYVGVEGSLRATCERDDQEIFGSATLVGN